MASACRRSTTKRALNFIPTQVVGLAGYWRQALDLDLPDYEDAVLHEAARHAGAEAIVTRDPMGFAAARLKL